MRAGGRGAQVLRAVRARECRGVVTLAAVEADGLEQQARRRVDAHAVVTRTALDDDLLEVPARQLELCRAAAVEVYLHQVGRGRRHGQAHVSASAPPRMTSR